MIMKIWDGPGTDKAVGNLPADTRPPEAIVWASYTPYGGFRQDIYAYAGEADCTDTLAPCRPFLLFVRLRAVLEDVYDETMHGPIPWDQVS